MAPETRLVLALFCGGAAGCERTPEDSAVVASDLGGGSCGGLYVETCDETPNPAESSGTITGRFDSVSLTFDIITAQVSDCVPPLWARLYSTTGEDSEVPGALFEAEFRLEADGTQVPDRYDFGLAWPDPTSGEVISYDALDRSDGSSILNPIQVEVEEIGTWTMKGSFVGVLSGMLDHEGEDIWIDGEFDVATESGSAACD